MFRCFNGQVSAWSSFSGNKPDGCGCCREEIVGLRYQRLLSPSTEKGGAVFALECILFSSSGRIGRTARAAIPSGLLALQ